MVCLGCVCWTLCTTNSFNKSWIVTLLKVVSCMLAIPCSVCNCLNKDTICCWSKRTNPICLSYRDAFWKVIICFLNAPCTPNCANWRLTFCWSNTTNPNYHSYFEPLQKVFFSILDLWNCSSWCIFCCNFCTSKLMYYSWNEFLWRVAICFLMSFSYCSKRPIICCWSRKTNMAEWSCWVSLWNSFILSPMMACTLSNSVRWRMIFWCACITNLNYNYRQKTLWGAVFCILVFTCSFSIICLNWVTVWFWLWLISWIYWSYTKSLWREFIHSLMTICAFSNYLRWVSFCGWSQATIVIYNSRRKALCKAFIWFLIITFSFSKGFNWDTPFLWSRRTNLAYSSWWDILFKVGTYSVGVTCSLHSPWKCGLLCWLLSTSRSRSPKINSMASCWEEILYFLVIYIVLKLYDFSNSWNFGLVCCLLYSNKLIHYLYKENLSNVLNGFRKMICTSSSSNWGICSWWSCMTHLMLNSWKEILWTVVIRSLAWTCPCSYCANSGALCVWPYKANLVWNLVYHSCWETLWKVCILHVEITFVSNCSK